MPEKNENNDFPLLLSLLTSKEAFVREVVQNSHKFPTYRHSYEALEEMLETLTGCRHYSSYASFRVAKSRVQNAVPNNQLKLF